MENEALEEVQKRLVEVNEVIEKIDPAIRASAFELFKDYIKSGLGGGPKTKEAASEIARSSPGGANLATLIERHGNAKPSDNAFLLTADWYRQYGLTPFSLRVIRESAAAAGLTIPARLDKTLKQASEGGKKLYQQTGEGFFRPTVPGELYLKKTYSVAKGTEQPSSDPKQ